MWLQEFVQCLEGSKAKQSRIEDAIAIKGRNLPKRIYKYRALSDYSRQNLETDTVWLCSPDAYNDPYDCAYKLLHQPVVVALKRRLVDAFVKSYAVQDVITQKQIEDAKASPEPLGHITEIILQSAKFNGNPKRMEEFCSLTTPKLVNDLLSAIKLWRKLIRVCSFSAVKDSLLMWSHYADKHQGFCMEYEIEALAPDHPLCRALYPVIYTDHLYDLTPWAIGLAGPDRQSFNPEGPLLGVLHKYEGWKYEEEWRVVSVTKSPIPDENWPVVKPTKVFLGSKVNAVGEKELLEICTRRRIGVEKMQLSDDKFRLLATPVTTSNLG
jgi:hypothetical protein